MGLVLAAARGQCPAAVAPEGAPRAWGHVSPAGRAGAPGGGGTGQRPPEAPSARDFATLQPRRLHRRPRLPKALRRRLRRSRLPEARGEPAGGRGKFRGSPGPGVWKSPCSRREKPTWSRAGSNRPEWGGAGRGGAAAASGARAALRDSRALGEFPSEALPGYSFLSCPMSSLRMRPMVLAHSRFAN